MGALEDLGGYGNLEYGGADQVPSDSNIIDINGPRPLFVGNKTFVLIEDEAAGVTRIEYIN